MSIHILSKDINEKFNIDLASNSKLLDLKMNGKYIKQIYYCNQDLFSFNENNGTLIYKRGELQFTFSYYDMLNVDQLTKDNLLIYDNEITSYIYKQDDNFNRTRYINCKTYNIVKMK